MKRLLFSTSILVAAISLNAQWQSNGDSIYYNNGNVGIGTSSPQTQLQIERPEGHTNGATLYLKHGKVGSHFSQNTSGGVLHLYDGDSISQTILRSYGDSYINSKLGNVGIGTTEPSAKLQVTNGDIYISDIDKGIIMKSPDGTCWRGTVDNSGLLNFTIVECPDTPPTSSIEAPKQIETTATNISIYPNPAKESVYIETAISEVPDKTMYEVFSMTGSLVKSGRIESRFTKVDVSRIIVGTYILKISNSSGQILSIEEIIKN